MSASCDFSRIHGAYKPDEWIAGCAAPVAAPAAAAPINQSLLYFKGEEEIVAYPGTVFTGNNGCSPSGLLSFLTIEQQASQLYSLKHSKSADLRQMCSRQVSCAA